jgi:hypothetical protein
MSSPTEDNDTLSGLEVACWQIPETFTAIVIPNSSMKSMDRAFVGITRFLGVSCSGIVDGAGYRAYRSKDFFNERLMGSFIMRWDTVIILKGVCFYQQAFVEICVVICKTTFMRCSEVYELLETLGFDCNESRATHLVYHHSPDNVKKIQIHW